jgi:CDP-alcohol phosphatidyltransferase
MMKSFYAGGIRGSPRSIALSRTFSVVRPQSRFLSLRSSFVPGRSSIRYQSILTKPLLPQLRQGLPLALILPLLPSNQFSTSPSTSPSTPPPPPSPPQEKHENIYTIPNILTFTRLAATPVIAYLILHHQPYLATGLLLYAGLTDLVDGWIARRWNLKSVVGTIIDPMADKFLMISLTASLAWTGQLPGFPPAPLLFIIGYRFCYALERLL